MQDALSRLGVPEGARVLEPGCGTGNFLTDAWRCIGVEQDSISGRIAKARHPDQDIRIENFADTRLPELDAVIGNVPFADVRLDYRGQKFALHDYFLAKSVDALTPVGCWRWSPRTTAWTSRTPPSVSTRLESRLPGRNPAASDAFKREGTAVVTDIVFLRKRSLDEPPNHADPDCSKPSRRPSRASPSDQPLLPEPPGAGTRHLHQ